MISHRETYEKLPNGTELYCCIRWWPKTSQRCRPYLFGVLAVRQNRIWSDRFRLSCWWRPQNCGYYHRPSPRDDLSENPYYTDEKGLRIVLLNPEQFDAIPDRTVLFDTGGNRYLKGVQDIVLDRVMGGSFVDIGFPMEINLGLRSLATSVRIRKRFRKNCIQTTSELMMAPR